MTLVPGYKSMVWTAIVTGIFSAVVGAGLVFSLATQWRNLPLDEPQYLALKKELETSADNQQRQQQLRDLDVRLRHRYFRQQIFMQRGGYLLAGGLIVTLLLVRWSGAVRRRLPGPKPAASTQDLETGQNRIGKIAAVGLVLALTGLVFVYHFSARQPPLTSLMESPPTGPRQVGVDVPELESTPAAPLPTQSEIAANWPRFRGPQGRAVVTFDDVPRTWNFATGQGVLWKSTVELPGVSSPIIWGNRIFLTGASPERQEVYCLDADNGQLLWSRPVADRGQVNAELSVEASTGFAASTPATDGQRVYAIFANGDLVAFDFDGNQLWSHAYGPLDNPYGHASSLATYRDLLIVQLDQGSGDDQKSRLLAIDGATGELVWQVARQVPASWATPLVIEFEDLPRIITAADPWVIANAAEDGRELWRAECLSGDVGPSPVYADGVVYVANDHAAVAAIQDGGQGDVTHSHMLWTARDGLPDICSPLVTGEFLLLVPSYGGLVSYRRAVGEQPLWEEDLGAMLMASPSLVGSDVYLISEDGRGWVIRPDETGFEQIAENDIGERCSSSPAFQPGRIYIRGESHLFCIGNP